MPSGGVGRVSVVCAACDVLSDDRARYWSKLDGDGDIVWGRACSESVWCQTSWIVSPTHSSHTADPQLTPLGEQQALDARSAWETERFFGVPTPEKLYTSPLTRAIRTNQFTFEGAITTLSTTIKEVNRSSHVPMYPLVRAYPLAVERSRTGRRPHLRQAAHALRDTRRVPRIHIRGRVRRGRSPLEAGLSRDPRGR